MKSKFDRKQIMELARVYARAAVDELLRAEQSSQANENRTIQSQPKQADAAMIATKKPRSKKPTRRDA